MCDNVQAMGYALVGSMSGQSAPPPAPPGGSMMFMLLFMIVMTFMLMSEGIRTSMGNYADPFLSGWLPDEKWFVITVLILGSISMFKSIPP